MIMNYVFWGIAWTFLVFNSANAAQLVPHRAYYKVALLSASRDSDIVGAEGTMVLEMKDECDGWTIEQKSQTELSLKSAPVETLSSTYVAWESKMGDKLRFYANRIHDGEVFEGVNGVAEFKKGVIIFATPQELKVPIGEGTLPPIQHLTKLLQAARAGSDMVSNEVFDGSSFGKPVQINTFIAKKKAQCLAVDPQGANQVIYPMQLAVYGAPDQGALPNFEISQNYMENGIMCSYTVDFGDYKVQGKLDRVEHLPQRMCKNKKT